MDRIKNFLFKNSSAKQTVVKNTLWLFTGEGFGRVLKFSVIVFATRVLGVEGWGLFSYALAFVSVFYVFGDIGINTFVTREISKGGEEKYQYLSASLLLKLALLSLSLIISLLFIPRFSSVTLALRIVLALALLNFSDAFREFVLSINRALERMEREAFIKILVNVVTAALGITLLLIHPTPLALAIAYASGSIVGSIAALWILLPQLRHIRWRIPKRVFGTILSFAWPFVATTVFLVVIANIDTIMLGQLKSTIEVGYYAAAERIVQFLVVIPMFIALSTFPLMTKRDDDPASSSRIFETVMSIVCGFAFPLVVGGILLSKDIMSLLFGASYAGGAMVLAILMLSVLADFPNIILSNVIFVKNLQKKFVLATAIGVVVNVLMNLYLIPRYGAVGAALSTVGSQLLIMTINWRMLKKFFSFSVVPKLANITLATLVMFLAILVCSFFGMHLLMKIIIAIIVYTGSIFALKEPMLFQLISIIRQV